MTAAASYGPAPDAGVLAEQAERHQLALETLAEIGMDMAQALRRDVVAAAAPTAPAAEAEPDPVETAASRTARMRALRWGDPALAFSRLSRAIRLTLALEARVVRGEDIGAPPVRARAAAPDPDPDPYPDGEPEYHWTPTREEAEVVRRRVYRKVVARIVGEAIEAEPREAAERERLWTELCERVTEVEHDETNPLPPIGDLINQVRVAIGLPALDEPWGETERSKFRAEVAEHRARRERGEFRVGPPPGQWRRGRGGELIPRSAYAGTSTGSPPGPGP